jgi:formate/nitrite transporter FocA (FNT family)
VHLGFVQAVALGVMCNVFVWLTSSARTTVDKIGAIVLPITAFGGRLWTLCRQHVLCSVRASRQRVRPPFADGTGLLSDGLTWQSSIASNLLLVTIGSILGGAVLVAAVYLFIYLRPRMIREG